MYGVGANVIPGLGSAPACANKIILRTAQRRVFGHDRSPGRSPALRGATADNLDDASQTKIDKAPTYEMA